MIYIAIMGLGTVGTGVAKLVEENSASIQRKLGEPLEVKSILMRRMKDGPYRSKMTTDFADILNDPEIRVVVETIGGVGAAYDYTRQLLAAGKIQMEPYCSAVLELEDWEKAFSMAENKEGYKILFQLFPTRFL